MSWRVKYILIGALLLVCLNLALSCASPQRSALVTITEAISDSLNPRVTVVVKDSVGQIEVGASVWLIDEENNRIYKVVSNIDGEAVFASVAPSNNISLMVLPDETRLPVIKSGVKVNPNQSLIINVAVICVNECAV